VLAWWSDDFVDEVHLLPLTLSTLAVQCGFESCTLRLQLCFSVAAEFLQIL